MWCQVLKYRNKEKLSEKKPYNQVQDNRPSDEWQSNENYINSTDPTPKILKRARKNSHAIHFNSQIIFFCFAILFSSSFFCWSFLSLVRLFGYWNTEEKYYRLKPIANKTRMIHKTESTMELVSVGIKNMKKKKNHRG